MKELIYIAPMAGFILACANPGTVTMLLLISTVFICVLAE